MKSLRTVTSLSLLLLVGANVWLTTGCSSTRTQESTGEYIDDSAITAKVKAAFVKDDMVRAREIAVETFKGTVQLSGFVNTPAEKTHAAEVASRIAGVVSVQNNIAIK